MKKTLIAYFSASGSTKKVAESLAKACDGDLFEIEPVQKYTAADLNWMNKNSRSSVEMANKNSRPEIKNRINIDKYNNIFVGFPIWWYREPSIVDTFMESYNFSGKTVIPFATSGGSGLGETTDNLQKLANGARVVDGKVLKHNSSPEDLKPWVDSLSI